MNKYLGLFINYIKYNKNYSKYTIDNYERDISNFNKFLKTEGINNIKDINHKIINFYLISLNKKDLAATTISRQLSSLRSYFNFLVNDEYLKVSPMLLISNPKKVKRLPNFLYYNELTSLLENINTKTPIGKRNYLIIEMLYSTGLRVSELVNIKITDIDTSNCNIKILGKGNKERIVLYGEYLSEILIDYLTIERKELLCDKDNAYLFLNKNGGQLTDRGIRLIIKKEVTNSKLDINVSPHTLRHTFATHMLNEGADILSVKELLGHSSLSSTGIYTHVTNDKLKEVYLKCHPRRRK